MIDFTRDLDRVDWNEAAEVIRQAPLGTRRARRTGQDEKGFFQQFRRRFRLRREAFGGHGQGSV